jgi:hypothetical protein
VAALLGALVLVSGGAAVTPAKRPA